MENFRHSLRYLWPYRGRLAVAIVCVIFISILWGGGIGMVLPGLKVLASEEGLHGWAWNSMLQDRLGVQLVLRIVPVSMQKENDLPAQIIDVVSVDQPGPAGRAGLRDNMWIVGLLDADGVSTPIRADVLIRKLALSDAEKSVKMLLFDQYAERPDARMRVLPVRLQEARFATRLLGRIAVAIPEPQSKSERFGMLLWLLVIGLGTTVLRDIFRFTQEYMVQTAVYRATIDLRCDSYTAALRLPMTYFSEHGTSEVTSRFVQDTNVLAHGQITLFGKTLVEPGKAIGSLLMALFLSWQLTLVAMVAGPPTFVLIRKFGKRMRRASRRALESWASILAVLEETLTGIRVVKAYTMEGSERRRFFRANRRLFKEQKRMAAVDAATAPAVETLGVAAAMTAAGIAGFWVLGGRMDPFVFMAWMGCLAGMFDPFRRLAKVTMRFQRAETAGKRIFDLYNLPQEKQVPNAPMLPKHNESIRFSNVSFRYPSAAEYALKNIDLTIRAGEVVAIVGPNGSGKTTLVSLLPRLGDPTEGQVFIDGCDISQYSLRSLRRQIGLVTQETILFHATIAENISYGLRRPKDQDVLAAARKAFVDEFVRDLPDGFDTMLSERGATLSGGQRQRIAIARAILRDPAILIFDEAMSQVDSDSERRIHQATQKFFKGRTTLLIAHRFATVLSADRIAVMDAGRIIDTGTHDELMGKCPLYHHLYTTQFIDSSG